MGFFYRACHYVKKNRGSVPAFIRAKLKRGGAFATLRLSFTYVSREGRKRLDAEARRSRTTTQIN